jgi:hypothetical protein
VSPGWPNGGTHLGVMPQVLPATVGRTRGTETSQYPEEEKSTGPFEGRGRGRKAEAVRSPE